MNKRFMAIVFTIALAMFVFAGCADDNHESTPTTPTITDTGTEPLGGGNPACITPLGLGVLAAAGYGSIQSDTQCEDDLYYEYVGEDLAICTFQLKWDLENGGVTTTYNWVDARNSGNSGCYHYANFIPGDAFLMNDSSNRVLTAMDDPNIYDRCFVATNPTNGETVYTIVYDDPNDPAGTVRRTLTLTVTPNSSCN
ncbi:MAG TPA: hypothetical protein VFX92_12895 [Candidatus Krumholzibacteria bacterium]|nr:hypothetical protein [Candidatus Krumholzibacteria bacterium]